jgi:hypothetical protein
MERLGKEMSGHWHIFVADPSANRALARGDAKEAMANFLEIAEDDEGTANEYNYRGARPAAWLGDLPTVRGCAERLEDYGGWGPILIGRQEAVRAYIAALEGRHADALTLFRETLRNFRTAHAVFDEALVGLDMAKLLDPAEAEVAAVVAYSRETFERVGAKPYLEQLDAAVGRAGQQSSGPAHVRKAEVAAANS